MQVTEIRIDDVKKPAGRHAKRTKDVAGLTEFIKAIGIINPIQVAQRNGKYEVIAGHRRLGRPSLLLGPDR